jgi:hypothetical protein
VPILHDFERRLGGLVEGLFAKTFRSGLQPIELAKRLLREMDAGKTVGVRDVMAPNRFVFSISAADAERFKQAEQALARELEQVVRDHAAERDWDLLGTPRVEFGVDDGLKTGEFTCTASLVEDEQRVKPAPPGGATLVVVEAEGKRTVRLPEGVATIGRLPDCDVVVRDPGASRRHAQITSKADSFTLTDLGSTNGTRLNGETIQVRDLEDGDRITIGTTVLEFRRGK